MCTVAGNGSVEIGNEGREVASEDFSCYMVIDDSLTDSIPEPVVLSFEKREAAELFNEKSFLIDSTSEAAGLSFKLETTELFEKFCFSDPASEAAELSPEEPFGPNAARPSDLGVPGAAAIHTNKESQKITGQFQSDHEESAPAPLIAKPQPERQTESLIDLTDSSESELSPHPQARMKLLHVLGLPVNQAILQIWYQLHGNESARRREITVVHCHLIQVLD
ncbi:hypothetical protein F5882DRAFT_377240 [Hyaloscypha sp. PMI_1271]|nr:hypothetical protein F5882DRAFT_377240 [Hyaloscypha sp. PMI_1271]